MTRREAQVRQLVLLAYLGLNVAWFVAGWLIVGRRHPDLVKERLRPGPGAKEGLRQTLVLYGLPWLGHYVVAILDRWRFRWSGPIPLHLQEAGLVGYTAALAVLVWAPAVNPFFSSVVRIQRERGHRVITTGPYRYVRHPGYAASIVMLLSSSLALGSWWSFLPTALWIAAIVRRARLEDRVLHAELDGYADYAERVRYRLVPGIW